MTPERNGKAIEIASAAVADSGKVRIGTASPSLPPVKAPPAKVVDGGKVRIGTASPIL